MSREEAVTDAVTYCINNDIMREFLKEHSGEVLNMLTAEFDIEKYGDARERRGMEKANEKVALKAIKKNIPISDISEMTGLTVEKITELKKKIK